MKAIVKTWRNRLPVISDDLSHWSEIFTWRQHHYQVSRHLYLNTILLHILITLSHFQFIAKHYTNVEQQQAAAVAEAAARGGDTTAAAAAVAQQSSNHSMLGVHASAQVT